MSNDKPEQSEREILIDELRKCEVESEGNPMNWIADFILADRRRIVAPLVKAETHILRFQTQEPGANIRRKEAIDEALKLALGE